MPWIVPPVKGNMVHGTGPAGFWALADRPRRIAGTDRPRLHDGHCRSRNQGLSLRRSGCIPGKGDGTRSVQAPGVMSWASSAPSDTSGATGFRETGWADKKKAPSFTGGSLLNIE